VKGSNTEAFDEFGSGVALSRNGTLAVGARSEDGGARGANGGEIDNSVTDSGTVYLFNYLKRRPSPRSSGCTSK
jgi:hypothetical protein